MSDITKTILTEIIETNGKCASRDDLLLLGTAAMGIAIMTKSLAKKPDDRNFLEHQTNQLMLGFVGLVMECRLNDDMHPKKVEELCDIKERECTKLFQTVDYLNEGKNLAKDAKTYLDKLESKDRVSDLLFEILKKDVASICPCPKCTGRRAKEGESSDEAEKKSDDKEKGVRVVDLFELLLSEEMDISDDSSNDSSSDSSNDSSSDSSNDSSSDSSNDSSSDSSNDSSKDETPQ